jgi:D-amino peptidase
MRWSWCHAAIEAAFVLGVLFPIRTAGAQPRATMSVPGRIASTPAPDRDGIFKVLLFHDMEGLAGQADPRSHRFAQKEAYAFGRELLMADVNAVVDGLFAGGADSVLIVDGHGSGNREPDIVTEKLDPRAKQLFRDAPFRPWSGGPVLSDVVAAGEYDAVAAVGMHGKIGRGGFEAHTSTMNVLPYLNGASVTEAEQLAFGWGRHGVPLIFMSGDDRLWEDIRETLPWVDFVVTKKSLNGVVRELLPVKQVHAEMREKARLAALHWRDKKAVVLTTPIQAALQVFAPATLEPLRGMPGITFEQDRVTFTATDIRAALEGVWSFISVAVQLGSSRIDMTTPGGNARRFHGAW